MKSIKIVAFWFVCLIASFCFAGELDYLLRDPNYVRGPFNSHFLGDVTVDGPLIMKDSATLLNETIRSWNDIANTKIQTTAVNTNKQVPIIRIYRTVTGTAGKTSSPYRSTKYDVTDDSISEYMDGMVVCFKVPVAGIATYGVGLQINGLGYKPIVYNANSTVSTRYPVNSVVWCVYNSTQKGTLYFDSASSTSVTGCWQVMDYDANTQTLYQQTLYYGTKNVTSNLYRYTLVLRKNETELVPIHSVQDGTTANASTSTNKQMTTEKFDPFGPILYYNTSAIITNGNPVKMSTLYWQVSVSAERTLNCGSNPGLTLNKEIYLVVNIDHTDGMATLANPAWSQDLPTTNDGKYYIFLGLASAAAAFELYPWHPIYYHDGTELKMYTGASTSAEKLETARTIEISGAATSIPTSFDGSQDISIPITSMGEAYLQWGGTNVVGGVSPVDAAAIDSIGGNNKFAFLPASCVNVAYSTDGGTTWIDYGASDVNKIGLTTLNTSLYLGGSNTSLTQENATNLMLRIRINSGATGTTSETQSKIYTQLKKLLINCSSPGEAKLTVGIRYRTIAKYLANDENSWSKLTGSPFSLYGQSGWNSIPCNLRFGGYSNQTGFPGEFEFTFYTTVTSTASKSYIRSIYAIGTELWMSPSYMASKGHIYTYDHFQNATFPNSIGIAGPSIFHSSYTYTLPSQSGTLALTSDLSTLTLSNAWFNDVEGGYEFINDNWGIKMAPDADGSLYRIVGEEGATIHFRRSDFNHNDTGRFTTDAENKYWNFDTTLRPTWNHAGLATTNDVNAITLDSLNQHDELATELDEYGVGIQADPNVWNFDERPEYNGDGLATSNEVAEQVAEQTKKFTTTNDVIAIIRELVDNGGLVIGDYEYKLVVERKRNIADTIFYFDNGTKIVTNLTSIPDNMYSENSSLTKVEFGNAVTIIGESAFYGCDNLQNVVIPSNVTSIDEGAFEGCNKLESIILPSSITSINNRTFYSSGLKNIEIPDSITSIGDSAFDSCWFLTSVKLGNGVTNIGENAFYNCKLLESVILQEGLVRIGAGAFWLCSKLKNVIIPSSVINIENAAFIVCNGLESMTFSGKDKATVKGMTNYSNWGIPNGVQIICTDETFSYPDTE